MMRGLRCAVAPQWGDLVWGGTGSADLAADAAAVLQGNVIEKLPDYLMKIYGIPKKYFLVKK